ncbi:glycoside hydrolase [Microdochium bolleyi]|uniref:lytic cellulose monooxygenase (C4-dehydrogenating) n=1 Tax=Microdochium bolleyi TaxID=196109 RepID=A0A136IQN3_9PEZI|nr:glycoside hydrolase [Microdochium bolleyi]
MKFISSLLLLGSAAQAHYTIPRASANGVSGADWQFTRITSNFQSNGPVTDVSSSAMTCYERNPGSSSASTLAVTAGGTMTFGIAPNIYHPGPLNIYMAKAPSGSAATFDGKGAVWFKVYQDQPKVVGSGLEWPNNGLSSVTLTIPKCIPNGEYLVRFEHIGLHSASSTNGAQLYISCTQVRVSGGSGSTPSNLLSFPGSYKSSDPGLLVNIYYPVPTNYKAPGGNPLVC